MLPFTNNIYSDTLHFQNPDCCNTASRLHTPPFLTDSRRFLAPFVSRSLAVVPFSPRSRSRCRLTQLPVPWTNDHLTATPCSRAFSSRYSMMHCSVFALALMYSDCCFSRRISNALIYMIFKLFLQACIERISERERGGPKRIWADGECYLTLEHSPLWQPLPTASNGATMAGVPTLIDAFYRAVTYSQGGKAFYCLVSCGRWFYCAPMLGILVIFPPMSGV